MARKPSLRKRLSDLIDRLEPDMRKAFMASVDDIKSQIVLKQIVEALERRDVEAAVMAFNIEPAAYRPLERALVQAYEAGGRSTIIGMPTLRDAGGAVVNIRFDVRNLRAEQWIQQHSSNLVTNLVTDQRVAVRGAINAGYSQGQGPRQIALDIAGRLNSAGKREGGIIGLTDSQAGWVREYETALREMPLEALTRQLRDKRFDPAVRKAAASGEPIPADLREKMVTSYENRALRYRAESIARTETGEAVMAAKYEAFHQGFEKTGRSEQDVIRTWRTAGDRRVRDTHAAMNGQVVQGLNTPFVSPSGALMLHPLDRSLGAGAADIINCRCDDQIDIDFSAGLT